MHSSTDATDAVGKHDERADDRDEDGEAEARPAFTDDSIPHSGGCAADGTPYDPSAAPAVSHLRHL
jgi:hypothetical protein